MSNAIRIFQTRWFSRWAAKEGLPTQALRDAVDEMEQGLIDAYLGDRVVKKRIALAGRGKRGGVRTILAFQLHDRAFFIFGFAKNALDNIDAKDLQTIKKLAAELLGYDSQSLDDAIRIKKLIEVHDEEK